MAFDGVVIANIVYDMNRLLTGGRIYKIYQPEADELLLVVKNNKETYRLLISAGASLPLIYFTTKTKANPMTALTSSLPTMFSFTANISLTFFRKLPAC